MKIIAGVSNKHAHLTQEQVEALFGEGYELTFYRPTKQPDEYVCNEKINVAGPRGTLQDVRIVGPARKKAQIEMTLTNAREIGVETQIRTSAHVEGTSGVKLIGPKGECNLQEGVITAMRHLHMNPGEAEELGLFEGQDVSIETFGVRGVIFKNVRVRINELFSLEFHVDIDEANAAGLKNGDEVKLYKY